MKKVTYGEIAAVLEGLLAEERLLLADTEFVVGVSRGGLFPAMVVSTSVIKPLLVAYIDKQDNVYFDRAEWVRGKKVLLVDDIVRTGKTLGKIKELLLKEGAASVRTLTPYYLEEAKHRAPDHGQLVPEDIAFPWDE